MRYGCSLLSIYTTTTTAAATATVATISTATVYQLSPPGSHRVYAVGPGGLSYVPMKWTILKSPAESLTVRIVR